MFELTNTHIIIILIILIVFTFIYNYDVYVVIKGEPICKPVIVTKKVIDANFKKLNSKEMGKELQNIVMNDSILEKFTNIELIENFQDSKNFSVPDSSLLNLNIPEVNTHYKKVVVDNLLNVLHNIPTNFTTETIKELVEYFAIIYQTSNNIDKFFDNVASSTKINQEPYNSQYSHLILYLIAKFDSIYNSECMNKKCIDDIKTGTDSKLDTKKCKVGNKVVQELINDTISPKNISVNELDSPTSSQQITPSPVNTQQIVPTTTNSQQITPTSINTQQITPSPINTQQIVPTPTSSQRISPTRISSPPSSEELMPIQLPNEQIIERFYNIQSYNNNFNGFASF